MKKIKLISICVFALIAITVIFNACRKTPRIEDLGIKPKINLLPVSFPNLSLEQVNDQIRSMAYAMASIQDTMFMENNAPNDYKQEIENNIPNDQESVSFEILNDDIITSSSTIYETPAKSDYVDFQDLVQGALDNQYPLYYALSPRSWAADFYNSQAYANFEYDNTDYSTILKIPEWDDLKNDNNRYSRPLLVVPHEVDTNDNPLLPIIGFKMNFTTLEIDTVYFQTEEAFEDNTSYYIWVVDYEPVPVTVQGPSNPCTGADQPLPNDDFCDIQCGENFSGSFNDCNPAFLRRVWIEEIEINEDYKQKCGTNYQWVESRFNGRYEIAFQAMTVHSSGKVKQRGGVLQQAFTRSQIKKSKKLGSCSYNNGSGSSTNKGSLTTQKWWVNKSSMHDSFQNNQSLQPKCYLSLNYKPWRDTIYFIIYEWDNHTNKRSHDIQIIYRPGLSQNLNYTVMKNEGPWGDKKSSNLSATYSSIHPTVPTGQVYKITPGTWPGGGGPGVNSDEWTFVAQAVNSGSSPDARSITVKVKYGFN